jgi:hypothetical protein
VTTNFGPFSLTARRKDIEEITATFTPTAPITYNNPLATDAYYTTDASGQTGISAVNASTKTVTIDSGTTLTIDRRYDWIKWYLSQNLGVPNFLAPSGTALGYLSNWNDSIAGTSSAGTKLTSTSTGGTVNVTGTVSHPYQDANNAGQITVVGVLNAETVEFRKSSDNSVIASRTGPGSFAIAPANVGIQAYFLRLSGSNTVMSTITSPVTLTTGVNPDVPLYAGAEVQVAQAARIEQLPTLAQIEASTLASDTASAVWDAVLTGATHNVTASAGRRLRTLSDTVILIDGVGNTMSNVAGVGYITLPDATTVCIKQAIRVGDMVRYVREFDSTTKVATLDSPWCTVTAGDVDYTIFNGRESSLSTGPTLAEIEASTVLAKETSVQAVKSTTGLIPYLLVK